MKVPFDFSYKKFLIIDDDSDDRDLFAEALATIDPLAICYGAANGQKAMEVLETNSIEQPDIIFLDLNMPVMNGWEFLARLKSLHTFRNIPVIIHTTSSNTVDRQLAKELGAICFLTKFDDFRKLKQMLEIVVEKLTANAIDSICEAVYGLFRPNYR